ncbi:MAG: PSD1 and planctomycete cytochrome C domain-containing protein [Planctomycetota bacterium]|nr:PSD1 and planctomycete cytochrome C domain-containing protein [Planctomycetota bacterium]
MRASHPSFDALRFRVAGLQVAGLRAILLEVSLIGLLTSLAWITAESPALGDEFEFFESKIRPALHTHCLECHHQSKKGGGLALDSRAGWQLGGDSGPSVDLKTPQNSLLLRVLKHLEPGLEMPSKAPKLTQETIDLFEHWIATGAADPRNEPEALESLRARNWEELYEERSKWWAFKPIKSPENRESPSEASSLSTTEAIDHWIDQGLAKADIVPSEPADAHTLLRRLSYQLRGLPPSIEEIERFVPKLLDPSTHDEAWQAALDAMLETTEYAEHWARHWMDTVRYAETHGSEDDAYLPFAYRYRDYLIRAFANDLSIQRLIQEHLAGDLIEPRWNDALDCNESLIGLCFYRLVEFNQTPLDVKREEIAVIDNQIDTIGKAFQGLTISCARCHDHKFDPISDEDFYSLYGILRSTRSAMVPIDRLDPFVSKDSELKNLQKLMTRKLIESWIASTSSWDLEILEALGWVESRIEPGQKWDHPKDSALADWIEVLAADPQSQVELKERIKNKLARPAWNGSQLPPQSKILFDLTDLTDGRIEPWRVHGAGLAPYAIGLPSPDKPIPDLAWSVLGKADLPLTRLQEPGYHSNLLTDRASGSLRSPDFQIDSDSISLWCHGTDQARARLVIENFQGDSLLFDTLNPSLKSNAYQWVTMRIRPQWKGLRAHIELLTRDAKPYLGVTKDPSVLERSDGRSSFGLGMVLAHGANEKPSAPSPIPSSLLDSFLADGSLPETWIRSTASVTRASLERLSSGTYTIEDLRWVNALLDENLMRLEPAIAAEISSLSQQYRNAESSIPAPRWVPGVVEDRMPIDQEWLPRGDHKSPGQPAARRYLQVLGSDPKAYKDSESGRLTLALEIANPTNPLTARVYVNRVWCWLFGEGLVRTVDNFGRMGQEPSHPELLDRLASDFLREGWSTKRLIRAIVTTRAWRRSSIPTASASQNDPANRLVSHSHLRRLEAESIRDTLLSVAGNLRRPDQGLGTRNYYKSVLEPNKQSPPGPIDGDSRRSIYLEVRRNFPDEFLAAFDFPKPTSTVGKRYTTHGPLQSLMLLNDPFVLQQARLWSQGTQELDPTDRIGAMYMRLLSRPPSDTEVDSALALIRDVQQSADGKAADGKEADGKEAWSILAHAMFNFKEAWFVR